MQLDRTRITIRERTTFELFDLALQVVRTFFVPLAGWLLLGAIPFAALNLWLLGDNVDLQELTEFKASYTWWTLWLIVLEMPLATAPATLYLGRVLFLEQPTKSQIIRDTFRSLPQILLLQGWLLLVFLLILSTDDAALMTTLLLLIILPFGFVRAGFRPYLNEIILLERNPLRASKTSQISTRRRSKALHSWSRGELFERFLASIAVGLLLATQLSLVIWGAKTWLTGSPDLSPFAYMLITQVALWIVVGFFTVVRFLCYLDLRIRREGWEVDLRMRAEATRLSQELF